MALTSISETQRTNLLELIVLMFDAAPGAQYLADITEIFKAANGDYRQVALSLGNTGVFKALHPNFEQPSEFADEFLGTVGLEGDADARAWVISQVQNGVPKAEIMYKGWVILDNLGAGAAPQYVNAAAIMHNKAEVSAYYSITLDQSSSDLDVLQGVIDGVDATHASVEAAEEQLNELYAQGPDLTPGIDNLTVTGTHFTIIEGVVDGDADDDTSGSTFNAGDRITGNGNTRLDLIVTETGDAGFERVTGVTDVNIFAATDGTINFNAAFWDVDMVALTDGVDGLKVGLESLAAGTVLGIQNVTGTVAAEYDYDGGPVMATLEAFGNNEDMSTLVLDEDGNITAVLGDEIYVNIENTDSGEELTLGDVDVTAGDSSTFSIEQYGGGAIGTVMVDMGDDATLYINDEQSDNENGIDYGAITVHQGDDSYADIAGFAAEGDVDAGAISVTQLDNSTVTVSFTAETGDVDVGAISLMAGTESVASIYFDGEDGEDQALTVTSVTATVGADPNETLGGASSVTLSAFDFGTVSIGAINLTAGAGGDVSVSIDGIETSVTLGAVTLMAGDDVTFEVSDVGEDNAGSITIASITASGDDVSVSLDSDGQGTVSVAGAIMLTATDDATLDVYDHATVALHDVTVHAGGDIQVYIEGDGDASYTTGDSPDTETIPAIIANISVGDITLASDGNGAFVSLTVENGEDQNVGNITLGAVDLTASGKDAYASVYVSASASDSATAENEGTAVGTISIASVDVTVGNVSKIAASPTAEQWSGTARVWIASHGEDSNSDTLSGGVSGDVMVGDVTVEVGNGFIAGSLEDTSQASVFIGSFGEDGNGDISVEDVSIKGGAFSELDLVVVGTAWSDGAAIGSLDVGNVTLSGGEHANASMYVELGGYGGSDPDGTTIGDLTVGNVSVDVDQDSIVNLLIVHNTDSNSGTLEAMGDLSVGNIGVVAGDNSHVAVGITSYAGSFSSATDAVDGSFDVGNISVAVSATTPASLAGHSSVAVSVTRSSWNDDGAPGGDFSVGNITVSAAGAFADIDVNVYNEGSWELMGDTDVGDISVTAGANANVAINGYVLQNTYGDMGDVTFGDLTLHLGATSVGTVNLDVYAYGDIGMVDIGAVDIDAAKNLVLNSGNSYYTGAGTFNYAGYNISASGSVEGTTVGNITIDADDGGNVAYGVTVEGDSLTGAMIAGDLTLGVAVGSDTVAGGTIQVGLVNMGGAAADLTVDDITINVAGVGAADEVQVALASSGDVVIGDITVSGSGKFILDGGDHRADANTSFIYVLAGSNDVTVGNVDFSGYKSAIKLDLNSWVDHGAGMITGGTGADTISGTESNNIITGGKGADGIDITGDGSAGVDTIVTSSGDSGVTQATIDTISGFDGTLNDTIPGSGDKLDFNWVAGAANNYVEDLGNNGDAASFAQFMIDANTALNSTVKYYADVVGGNTYVAVSFGVSGDADMVIELVGNHLADLGWQNIIA